MKALPLLSLLCATAAVNVEQHTWDDVVLGKSVFVAFFHDRFDKCKLIQPDWDKLAVAFEDSKKTAIAHVDCTSAIAFCHKMGVGGFPTILYGDPSEKLKEYKGERDFFAFKQFVDENVGPSCSPLFIDACDADKRKMIEQFLAMSSSELDAAINDKEAEIEGLRGDSASFYKGWTEHYMKAVEKDKEKKKVIVKAKRLMETVQAYAKSASKSGEL